MAGRILLTGATGYVGGRLLAALEALGEPVRCMTRHPENLVERVGSGTVVVCGDVLKTDTLTAALDGCKVAYYLVHSMKSSGDFVDQDRRAAHDFGQAARAAGVERIIYLGGLGSEEELSSHLASRQEVGRVLSESGVATVELRASIIIGSGSLSFEMIRALVDRLPVMITPRWSGRERSQSRSRTSSLTCSSAPDPAFRQSCLRDRRRGPSLLRGHHAGVRSPARTEKRRLIPVPLLTQGYPGCGWDWSPGLCAGRAQARRELEARHRGVNSGHAAILSAAARRRSIRTA
ncbi:MAG: NAD(P)H-binding protein [Bryobacterales bacterium]